MGKSFGAMSSLIYCINPLQPPNSVAGGLRSLGQKCGAVERPLDHESGDKVSLHGLPLIPWAGLGGGKPLLTFSLKAKTMSCRYYNCHYYHYYYYFLSAYWVLGIGVGALHILAH